MDFPKNRAERIAYLRNLWEKEPSRRSNLHPGRLTTLWEDSFHFEHGRPPRDHAELEEYKHLVRSRDPRLHEEEDREAQEAKSPVVSWQRFWGAKVDWRRKQEELMASGAIPEEPENGPLFRWSDKPDPDP